MRQRHLISGASILRLWHATVVHSAQCFVNEVSMRAKPPRAHVCLYCVRILHFVSEFAQLCQVNLRTLLNSSPLDVHRDVWAACVLLLKTEYR